MTNGNGINVRKRDGSLTPLNLDKILLPYESYLDLEGSETRHAYEH